MKLSINGVDLAIEPIKRTSRKLKQELAQTLQILAEQELGEISARTDRGRDAEGSAFKPYTPAYARQKSGFTRSGKSRGRTAGGGTLGNKVNLRVTGQMLSGMRAKVSASGTNLIAKLFFIPGQAAKAAYNQAIRRFFGLSREQLDRIENGIRKMING